MLVLSTVWFKQTVERFAFEIRKVIRTLAEISELASGHFESHRTHQKALVTSKGTLAVRLRTTWSESNCK